MSIERLFETPLKLGGKLQVSMEAPLAFYFLWVSSGWGHLSPNLFCLIASAFTITVQKNQ